MGDMESRSAAWALMDPWSPKDPPIRNASWLSPRLANVSMRWAKSGLDRSRPSTHRAMRVEALGSFPRMAAASFSSAASTWAGEGFSGNRSSGNSISVSLQYRLRRLTYSAAASA